MQSQISKLANSSSVMDRYCISSATLYRWMNDDELNFPKPAYIRKRPYWRFADLDAFDEKQFEKQVA